MKKRYNLAFGSLMLAATFSGIVSCGPTTNPTSEETVPPEPFVSDVESNLVKDEDYVEHSKTYKSGKYSYDESKWYVNDLDKVPLPDPHIYVENDTYYITGTSDRSNGRVVDVYTTKDFVTFTLQDPVFDPSLYDGWENKTSPQIYAPEIYCFDGVYYLYYSAFAENGIRYNSVVSADNPLGPYKHIVNDEIDGKSNPVFIHGSNHVLDATVFVDSDNKMYMYYAITGVNTQYIAGVELTSPYTANWDTFVELVKPGQLNSINPQVMLVWETFRGFTIAEAPYMIKHGGKYYLTYSVNGCWNKYYNVCYAVSDSPLGNFEKPYTKGQSWTNLLLGFPGTNLATSKIYKQWAGFASGTGHHCFFNMGDQVMIGYHAHRNRDWNDDTAYTQRYFAFDYLFFDDEGTPYCNGPTWSPQPLPEALSGYKNIALNATVRVENVTNSAAINDNYNVDCYNLPQEEGKEVVLGNGLSYIELTFDKEYEIGGFAIYNSSFYDKAVYDIKYVDFGNGNAVKDLSFLEKKFMNSNTDFIFPNSAFTVEFVQDIKSNRVRICFDLSEGGQINEIVVLGK